jgi:hypothetical protein
MIPPTPPNQTDRRLGEYDGKELAAPPARPGALDYKKYPSLINGKRVAKDDPKL